MGAFTRDVSDLMGERDLWRARTEDLAERLIVSERKRDEATSLLRRVHEVDYLPWRGDDYWSNCEFCGAFDTEDHKPDCLWLTIGAFLTATPTREPPHE